MKIVNKMLDCFILIIVLFIIIYTFLILVEPLFYNNNSTGKELDTFEKYTYIENSLNNYIDYYKTLEFESIRSCTTVLRRKSIDKYKKVYDDFIKDKIKSIEIHSVQNCFNNIYIIEYSFNTDYDQNISETPDINKLIIKLKDEKFIVLFDSLLNKI